MHLFWQLFREFHRFITLRIYPLISHFFRGRSFRGGPRADVGDEAANPGQWRRQWSHLRRWTTSSRCSTLQALQQRDVREPGWRRDLLVIHLTLKLWPWHIRPSHIQRSQSRSNKCCNSKFKATFLRTKLFGTSLLTSHIIFTLFMCAYITLHCSLYLDTKGTSKRSMVWKCRAKFANH